MSPFVPPVIVDTPSPPLIVNAFVPLLRSRVSSSPVSSVYASIVAAVA